VIEPEVVVIDDEPAILALVRDVLESEGLCVLAVDTPDRALGIARIVRPDVFLVDLMLPGINGIELARRMREQGLTSTPMVAMSASRGMLSMAERSELFDEILAKPFELDTLLECVERFLDRRQTA
jgi:two-component system response regulator MtrA